MTTDLFDDLSDRLDAIAAAHTDHLELRHPAELPIAETPDAGSNRTVWLLAAAALLAVAAVWLGLRDGADLETEQPAVDPDAAETTGATTEVAFDDLPGVFRLDPLPEDDPVALAKAEWWTAWTIRRVDFDGGSVFVSSGGSGVDRLCLDVLVEGEDTLEERGEGSCTSLSGLLAGVPLWTAPTTGTPVVAGLIPFGTDGVTIDSGELQMRDDVFFALLDRPGVTVRPFGGEEATPSLGTMTGLLNGVAFEETVTDAACIQTQLGDWFVSAGGPTFWMRFVPLDFVLSSRDLAYEAAFIQRYTVVDESAADGTMRLRVDFDQADTEGTAAFACSVTLDLDEYSDRWYNAD